MLIQFGNTISRAPNGVDWCVGIIGLPCDSISIVVDLATVAIFFFVLLLTLQQVREASESRKSSSYFQRMANASEVLNNHYLLLVFNETVEVVSDNNQIERITTIQKLREYLRCELGVFEKRENSTVGRRVALGREQGKDWLADATWSDDKYDIFVDRLEIFHNHQTQAVYRLSYILQNLGAYVRLGAIPMNITLLNASRLILEDWFYCQHFIQFERDHHNAKVVDANDIEHFGPFRRHAEWLAIACAIYWLRTYRGGYIEAMIDQSFYSFFSDEAFKGNDTNAKIEILAQREKLLRNIDKHFVTRHSARRIFKNIYGDEFEYLASRPDVPFYRRWASRIRKQSSNRAAS